MTHLRTSHPGFYKVVLAYFLFHAYNGVVFLFNWPSAPTAQVYDVAFSVVPQQIWGAIFLALGMGLVYAVHKLPFKTARTLLTIGWLLDLFWFISFLLSGIFGHLDAPTAVSAWGALTLIEYAGTKEAETNPAMERIE